MKIKIKLPDMNPQILKLLNQAISVALYAVAIGMFIGGVVMLSAKAPEIHAGWIRNKVGSKTYLMTTAAHRGSGTGFAVKAPSGITYIVTNDHVCAGFTSSSNPNLLVVDSNGNEMMRKVIERSVKSDLCLVEGMPGVEGLSLSKSAPAIGQVIASVGHPAGYNITLSRGEVIQIEDVSIVKALIALISPTGIESAVAEEDGGILASKCNQPKNQIGIVNIDTLFGPLPAKACFNVTKGAYMTNMLIQPGSSGSPLVNFYGQVVGVVFASDSAHWGTAVSLNDLKDLLKLY